MFNCRRLRHLLSSSLQAQTEGEEASCGSDVTTRALSERFHHFMTPKLPHLLALLLHPTAAFPSTGVSLLIIDSISTVLTQAFAQCERLSDGRTPGKKVDLAQWAAGRRWAVMADLMSAMGKLAATRNMPVLVINQTTTRLRPDTAASLQPAISGVAWESGISCRILLFRDWQLNPNGKSNQDKRRAIPGLRFAGVTKTGGECLDGFGDVIAFTIDKHGLHEVDVSPMTVSRHELIAPPQGSLKRKRDGDEIPDSASDSGDVLSDDDFGWVEDATLDQDT
ncbi:MAG: hypothetical protein LQ350_000843 [Teloschistes chrysophthalmus]|nr:MAG: hypothetical protein LQ350_000843 [Niorma chrysophthalma]